MASAVVSRKECIFIELFKILLSKNESIDRSVRYFDSLIGILLNSSIKIHSFLETTAETYFVDLKRKVEIIRGRFPKST